MSSLLEHQLWVQCESPHCGKWRLLPQVNNGSVRLSSEEDWFCSMNPDPAYSCCTVRQQPLPIPASLLRKQGSDFVFSVLPVGSLVSAKIMGYPWWPAVLTPDPGMGMYLIRDGDVTSYHVEFLGNPHSRSWTKAGCVGSYRTIAAKEFRLFNPTLRKSWDFAIQEVQCINNMSCEERLLCCHFQPNELLIKAQKLMWDIEDQINQLDSDSCRFSQRLYGKDKRSRLCQDRTEEDSDTLIIDGFRFESAADMEKFRSSGSQPGQSNSHTVCMTND